MIYSLSLVIMTESVHQPKKTKAQLEQLVKANGGKIYQTNTAAENTICIADRSKSKTIIYLRTICEKVVINVSQGP